MRSTSKIRAENLALRKQLALSEESSLGGWITPGALDSKRYTGTISCHTRLGGVLNYYYRKAA